MQGILFTSQTQEIYLGACNQTLSALFKRQHVYFTLVAMGWLPVGKPCFLWLAILYMPDKNMQLCATVKLAYA